MPCAVALIAHAPHPEAGRRLIDFLLSADVDRAMLDAKFAWASARDEAKLNQVRLMDVDYRAVARGMPVAIRRATAILDGR
jgi:ABC-type Fe3+ transport system substrate-binding protein